MIIKLYGQYAVRVYRVFFFLYNILFFLSIIDNKINIKKQPRDTLSASCQHNLLTICLYQKNIFKIKMNACFMYHLLYQINKFKKIFGDKISYLIIVFHVTKGRKMIKLERCKLVMSLSKKRTLWIVVLWYTFNMWLMVSFICFSSVTRFWIRTHRIIIQL